ncbi:hypothetical protein ACQQ2N_00935 [Dokdonella sp. MW10]|uniref:hypothetical protein n=1 Tax=Dokdonella sp. MW10 TaxID=2992926 RepID=UPI003F7CEBD2
MGYIVVSSFESAATGDLQQPGESVVLYAGEAEARAAWRARVDALALAARSRRDSEADAAATFAMLTAWVALVELPVPAADVDEALETLEVLIEEADDPADELDAWVAAYEGSVVAAAGESPYPRARALDDLLAWLT